LQAPKSNYYFIYYFTIPCVCNQQFRFFANVHCYTLFEIILTNFDALLNLFLLVMLFCMILMGCAVVPASPVLMATGIISGQWRILTQTETTPLNQSPKYLSQVIMSATRTSVPNLVQMRPRGLLCKLVKYREFFHLLIDLFWKHLCRIFTCDGSKRCGIYPCLCLLDIVLHLGVKSPPPKKNLFWGMNRHFQAKPSGESLTISAHEQ